MMKTQVLIIGAGPTGLSLANQFIRYGVDFIIVDKKETVTELSKALIVQARTLEIYDQMGLAGEAVKLGEIMNRFRIWNSGKMRAEIMLSDMGKGLSPFPFALILEQSKNEHILYKALQNNGKEVFWQSELQSILQDENGVRAELKNSDGEVFEIEADYLVGCDGAKSQTRHLLNITFDGTTIPKTFYVADVEMNTDLPRNMLNGVFGGDGFALLMPMKGENTWRLVGNLPENNSESDEVSYHDIETKVKELAQFPLEITKQNWFSSYKIHTRHADKFSIGRCFIAGDACHVHTPAGGQGMNTGIQDAYNLAWKMSFVLKGLADKKLLETYDEERLANAIRLTKGTDEVFEYATETNWYMQLFRERIFPIVAKVALKFETIKKLFFPTISQIGISYHKESLSNHGGDADFTIKAGNRFPYFEIDGKNVFEFLKEPKFHFVSFGQGIDEGLPLKFAEVMDFQEFPITETIAEIFGTKEPFCILVRPDNYISQISKRLSSAEIKEYFQKIGLQTSYD